jgi:ABC-type Fe3+ transport system substrate-binding protein
MTGSKNVDAAKDLIDFMLTPDAVAVIRAQGLEPTIQ